MGNSRAVLGEMGKDESGIGEPGIGESGDLHSETDCKRNVRTVPSSGEMH